MARIPRPYIPIETRCRVVLRQLGEMFRDQVIKAYKPQPGDAYLKGIGVVITRRGLKVLLQEKLAILAETMNCQVSDFNLDHDPPLAAREKKWRNGQIVGYIPDANDPEHLFYRPHGPQFEGSHLIKTNVRGDRGQYPDRVLIKRQQRREMGKRPTPKRKWPSRPFPAGKRKIPSREKR